MEVIAFTQATATLTGAAIEITLTADGQRVAVLTCSANAARELIHALRKLDD